jgi:hypothetical protein
MTQLAPDDNSDIPSTGHALLSLISWRVSCPSVLSVTAVLVATGEMFRPIGVLVFG